MKRLLALLLVLIMCFSLVSCSESDDKKNDKKENEENNESFKKSEDFVGKWGMYQYCFGADGRTEKLEVYNLELREDGSAEMNVTTTDINEGSTTYDTTQIKSWKYSKRNDTISFEYDGVARVYPVCRNDDGSDAALGQGYIPSEDMHYYMGGVQTHVFSETFYKVNEGCDVCDPLPAGKYMNEYGEITVSDEGYLNYRGEEYDLNGIPCYGPNHLRYIDGHGCICYVAADNTIACNYDEYTKLNGEYISFTADNWTDYFSENFYDNFEILYKVNYGKDTWGDYHASVEYDYRLKDIRKYGEYTNITVEYTFEYSIPVVMEYNTATKKIVSVSVNYTPDDDFYTETGEIRIIENYEKPGCLEFVGSTSEATITETNGDVITMEFDLWLYPISINRMQGTLIMAE